MDKVNRHSVGERNGRPVSLSAQVKEFDRKSNLTPEDRIRELDPHEYERQLRAFLATPEVTRRHGMFSKRFLSWLFSAKKHEMATHHEKGTAFKELIPLFQDLMVDHMNL